MSLENVKIKMKLVVKYNSLKYAEDEKKVSTQQRKINIVNISIIVALCNELETSILYIDKNFDISIFN